MCKLMVLDFCLSRHEEWSPFAQRRLDVAIQLAPEVVFIDLLIDLGLTTFIRLGVRAAWLRRALVHQDLLISFHLEFPTARVIGLFRSYRYIAANWQP